VFTDYETNIFNGLKLKAFDRVLRLFLPLEEYEVTFEHLLLKKNLYKIIDALTFLDVYNLKIQEEREELSKIFSTSENKQHQQYHINILMNTSLSFKDQEKVKGLAQNHYSIKHIEGYDIVC
jgi:hypothetical protein